MKFDPQLHHRRSIRLKGYDYTQAGAYFVTLCAWRQACLFGEIVEGRMILNNNGRFIHAVWQDLPNHYSIVGLDAFVIMPNHVHAIIILRDPRVTVGAGLLNIQDNTTTHPKPAPTPTIVQAGLTIFQDVTTIHPKPAPTPTTIVQAGLTIIQDVTTTHPKPAPTPKIHGLPEIVRALKTFSARRINAFHHSPGIPVWQRNYYEHIIRSRKELKQTSEYIHSNPAHWNDDEENPAYSNS